MAIEGTGRPRPAWQDATPTPRRMREWVQRSRALEQGEPRVYPTFEDAVARLSEANRRLTPELVEHLTRWAARGIDGGFVWKYDPWLYSDAALDLRMEEMPALWENIECPVLHIIGSEGEAMRGNFMGKPVESYFKHGSAVHARLGALGTPRPDDVRDRCHPRVPRHAASAADHGWRVALERGPTAGPSRRAAAG